jgi:hypothetical protein
MRGASLSEEFSRSKVPLVCMLLLAATCDVTLLQLMPWIDSVFYRESMGYPSFHLLLTCMVVKTVQSLVSVVCQLYFMFVNNDLNDPLMSTQAKILFGMSITLSVVTLIMGAMTLQLKWSLFKGLNAKIPSSVDKVPSSVELGELLHEKQRGGKCGWKYRAE